VIQAKLFPPVVEMLEHFEAPGLHPVEQVRDARFDRGRFLPGALDVVGIFRNNSPTDAALLAKYYSAALP